MNGKKVLVRVDFNVPLNEQGKIADDTRIVAAIPTIEYLLKSGAMVILMSHLGRPKGKKVSEYSLALCAKRLSELLRRKVQMAPDCIGSEVKSMVKNLLPGDVLLLENLRFHAAEEDPDKDPGFAKELASLADFYVNDAFGAAHRSHSSITTIAQYFEGRKAPGLLLQKEIQFLGDALLNPKRPFYAIIGGAKISSKLGVLHSLLNKVDALFIGGGMSYTFLKAMGIPIGNSICENALLGEARNIISKAKEKNIRLELPVDIIASTEYSKDAPFQVFDSKKGVPDGFEGMDIGPETSKKWAVLLQDARTLFWNGPVGVAEFERFANGTKNIAQAMALANAVTIVGGGDSVAALRDLNVIDKMSHVSTGGGASLEYIEFGKLPGVEVFKL